MVDWTPIEFLDGNDGSGLELGERDRAVATSPINNVFEEKKMAAAAIGHCVHLFLCRPNCVG